VYLWRLYDRVVANNGDNLRAEGYSYLKCG
jgi:hypothetical protein